MKIKSILLIVAAVVVVFGILLLLPEPKKHYKWSLPTEKIGKCDNEPYGINLVDKFLSRSLDNGYSTRLLESEEASPRRTKNWRSTLQAIVNASADTSLLVVDYKDWELIFPEEEIGKDSADYEIHEFVVQDEEERISEDPDEPSVDEDGEDDMGYDDNGVLCDGIASPTHSLMEFAFKGGKAIYVEQHRASLYYNQQSTDVLFSDLGFENSRTVCRGSYEWDHVTPYSKEWFRLNRNCYRPVHVSDDDDDIMINDVFAPIYIQINSRDIDNFNRFCEGQIVMRPLMIFNESEEVDDSGLSCTDVCCYAAEFSFPETGGKLIITTLDLYYTNLGMMISGGPRTVGHLMSLIDDKPVARIDYHNPEYSRVYSDSHEEEKIFARSAMLEMIEQTPSLSLAWGLLLAALVCAFLNGLMRHHPVSRGFAADDLDKTDIVAVREYKFRKSPLLHFLFQCSCRFKHNGDYRELFDVNYRRVARAVSSRLNKELPTAGDQELAAIADSFSRVQERPQSQVLADLAWLNRVNAETEKKVSYKKFMRSQKIAETFLGTDANPQ